MKYLSWVREKMLEFHINFSRANLDIFFNFFLLPNAWIMYINILYYFTILPFELIHFKVGIKIIKLLFIIQSFMVLMIFEQLINIIVMLILVFSLKLSSKFRFLTTLFWIKRPNFSWSWTLLNILYLSHKVLRFG